MLSSLFKSHSIYRQGLRSTVKKSDTLRMSKGVSEESISNIVNHFMDKAAQLTSIPKDKMDFYKNCDSIMQINIPLRRENGTFETIKAYRVQHKTHAIPTKGGFIINDNVTKQDVQGFALLNTIRLNALDLPSGGAKGAICINPKNYSSNELEIIIRKFTLEAAKKGIIGSAIDVLGTDLGSTEREMNWIKDTFTNFFGQDDIHAIACVTGKGLNQGGLKGGVQSAGYGLSYTIKYMLDIKSFCESAGVSTGLKGKTFIIEGFGTVGYWAAHFLQKDGAKLVGVCEHDGQIYNPDGIDADDIHAYMKQHGGVSGYTKAKEIENTAFEPCDIFIPCYFAQSITSENADKFQCKIVAEGANLPTTPQGEQILKAKGIQIIPDIIASSGGLLSSYFEWLKNINHTQHGAMTRKWEEKSNIQVLQHINETTGLKLNQYVDQILEQIKGPSERDLVRSGIEDGFELALIETIETANNLKTDLRLAAYVNSLNKLHAHYEQVGITFSK